MIENNIKNIPEYTEQIKDIQKNRRNGKAKSGKI